MKRIKLITQIIGIAFITLQIYSCKKDGLELKSKYNRQLATDEIELKSNIEIALEESGYKTRVKEITEVKIGGSQDTILAYIQFVAENPQVKDIVIRKFFNEQGNPFYESSMVAGTGCERNKDGYAFEVQPGKTADPLDFNVQAIGSGQACDVKINSRYFANNATRVIPLENLARKSFELKYHRKPEMMRIITSKQIENTSFNGTVYEYDNGKGEYCSFSVLHPKKEIVFEITPAVSGKSPQAFLKLSDIPIQSCVDWDTCKDCRFDMSKTSNDCNKPCCLKFSQKSIEDFLNLSVSVKK